MPGASSPDLPRSLPPEPTRAGGRRAAAMVLVGGSVPPMDIDEFYEADPRRRASAELELGSEWLGQGRRPARAELRGGHRRALRAARAAPHVREDPFGGIHVTDPRGYENKITVHVIAKIATVDDLHTILEGWPEAMREQGDQGTQWLGQRLMAAGVAVGPTGDPISD